MTVADDASLAMSRARRIGLRRTVFYTYLSRLSWVSVTLLFGGALISRVANVATGSAAEEILLWIMLAGFIGAFLDVGLSWYLASRWGLIAILKDRARLAEEAADRHDHEAVLAALVPVSPWLGSAELFLLARSRLALKKAE